MAAIADLSDKFRENDRDLKLVVSRDAMRSIVSQVIGGLLNELAREPDPKMHWPMVRAELSQRIQNAGTHLVHYVPVWLFLGQECSSFTIGPVRFVSRTDWLDAIATRRGEVSSWIPGVRTLWAGRNLSSCQSAFNIAP